MVVNAIYYILLGHNAIVQSISQSINHEFLEWPKYLKHC